MHRRGHVAGRVDGIGSAQLLNEAFAKKAGDSFGPISTPAGTFFGKVVEKIPPDLTKLAAERDQFYQSLKSRKAYERRDLFRDGLVNELVKAKKIRINDEAVKRLTASYRSS